MPDCSYTEKRISKALAILEANYPEMEESKYIGFEIWGIRHFCTTYQKSYRGKTSLAELLEAMWTVYQCPTNFKDEILRLLIQVDTVELPS